MPIDLEDVIRTVIGGGTLISLLGGLYGYLKGKDGSKTTKDVKVDLSRRPVRLPSGEQVTAVVLAAANGGESKVVLNGHGFRVSGKRIQIHPGNPIRDVPLPADLSPGESVEVWFGERDLNGSLRGLGRRGKVKIVGYFRDPFGASLESGPVGFRV